MCIIFSAHGILQARALEWGAIAFSIIYWRNLIIQWFPVVWILLTCRLMVSNVCIYIMYHSSQSVFIPLVSSNQVPLGDSTHSITPFLHRRKQVSGGQWIPRSLGCWPRLKSLLSQVLLLAAGFDGQADFLGPTLGRLFTTNTWAPRQWGLGFPWIRWYQGSTWENLNFPLSWRRWCLCIFVF